MSGGDGKRPVQDLGFISCTRKVRLKHVPFYEPCLILVLSGRKMLFQDRRPIAIEAGYVATVAGTFKHRPYATSPTRYALKTDKLPLDENAPAATVGFYLHQNLINKAVLNARYGR